MLPAAFAAMMPVRIYPACATLEYASMRFTLVCEIAMMFPTIMDRAASTAIASRSGATCPSTSGANTRRKAAKAADLPPVDMRPLTIVGAPS